MLVAGAGEKPALLDFFVAAPGAGAARRARAELRARSRSTSADATQVFNCGAASCGVPGNPAGLAEAASGAGARSPLAELAAPAAALARDGVAAQQAAGLRVRDPRRDPARRRPRHAREFAPQGRPLREGEPFRIAAARRHDRAPRRRGRGAVRARRPRGRDRRRTSAITADCSPRRTSAAYAAIDARAGARELPRPPRAHEPAAVGGRHPARAGLRPARAARRGTPTLAALAEVMGDVQALRTPEFDAGLDEPGFLERFLGAQLGSTTHISVLDGEGRACSVTCTNGDGLGRSSCPAPASTSTTSWARRTSTRSASSATRRAAGCRR